jgi:tetratricopeptide (TPR) repeat protein
MALSLAAEALRELRRYREALVLQDQAIKAAEGETGRLVEEDAIANRLLLYTGKMSILRHLGRVWEAMDMVGEAAPLLRRDRADGVAAHCLGETAQLYEDIGELDLAIELDVIRVECDEKFAYYPGVVRRRALQLVGEGRRDDAIDTLLWFKGVLEQEAHQPSGRVFTAEGKVDVGRDFLQATLQLLQLLKDVLRESGAKEDGSLPRHVADELRQVGPLSSSVYRHSVPNGRALQTSYTGSSISILLLLKACGVRRWRS